MILLDCQRTFTTKTTWACTRKTICTWIALSSLSRLRKMFPFLRALRTWMIFRQPKVGKKWLWEWLRCTEWRFLVNFLLWSTWDSGVCFHLNKKYLFLYYFSESIGLFEYLNDLVLNIVHVLFVVIDEFVHNFFFIRFQGILKTFLKNLTFDIILNFLFWVISRL